MDQPNKVLVRKELVNLKESTDQRLKNQNHIEVKVDKLIIKPKK
jgi:hypothetical protein